jgi:hypothetical protein
MRMRIRRPAARFRCFRRRRTHAALDAQFRAWVPVVGPAFDKILERGVIGGQIND